MDAKLINTTTDLVSLVPGLRNHGRYFIGPCPFCGGEDRFNIKRTDEGDLWICRRCGDGKYHDAVAFRMRAEGRSFGEVMSDERRATSPGAPHAVPKRSELVTRKSSLVTGNSTLVTPPDEAWQISRLREQYRLANNLWLTDADIDALPTPQGRMHQKVWSYLRNQRGLSADTIRRAMLGYNDDWYQTAEGVPHPPGIHIPGMTGGQLWYVKVRLPRALRETTTWRGGRPPKYMVLRGSREALYQADRLVGARVAVVTEGEFDALLLGQFLPDGWAAVTMGSAALLPGETFLPYFTGLERVLLCLDHDAAGQQALAQWRRLLPWAEVAPPLPGGAKDLTELWRAAGELDTWIAQCR